MTDEPREPGGRGDRADGAAPTEPPDRGDRVVSAVVVAVATVAALTLIGHPVGLGVTLVLVGGLWTVDEAKTGSLEDFLRRYREALHG